MVCYQVLSHVVKYHVYSLIKIYFLKFFINVAFIALIFLDVGRSKEHLNWSDRKSNMGPLSERQGEF